MPENTPVAVLFENAVFKKVEEIRYPLINRFYAQCNYKAKCLRHDLVFSVECQGTIVAAARLLIQPEGNYLLRSLCVAQEYRQQGVATRLVQAILQQLTPHNCYCFALQHLQSFYHRMGFVCLSPELVPASVADLAIRYRSRGRDWVLMGFFNQHHK